MLDTCQNISFLDGASRKRGQPREGIMDVALDRMRFAGELATPFMRQPLAHSATTRPAAFERRPDARCAQ